MCKHETVDTLCLFCKHKLKKTYFTVSELFLMCFTHFDIEIAVFLKANICKIGLICIFYLKSILKKNVHVCAANGCILKTSTLCS